MVSKEFTSKLTESYNHLFEGNICVGLVNVRSNIKLYIYIFIIKA